MNSFETIKGFFQHAYDSLNEHRGGWEMAGERDRNLHRDTLIQISMGFILSNFWRTDSIYIDAYRDRDRYILLFLQMGTIIEEHKKDQNADALAAKIYAAMVDTGLART